MKLSRFLMLFPSLVVGLMAGEGWAQDVKVGVLYDATSLSAFQSVPYTKGIQAATRSANATGGINGKNIVLLAEDYAYQIPRALAAYKKLKGEGIVAMQGYGSGDTEALMDTVTRDKMPFFSAALSAHTADPKRAPYNYSVGADYSAQARSGLKHIADNWKDPARRPKIAIVYPDNAFGNGGLPAIQSYAKELNLEVVGKEVLNFGALESSSQVARLRDLKPDFVWMQAIASTLAVFVRDAKKGGLDAKVYGSVWTYDPKVLDLAGDAIEGTTIISIAALSGRGLPAEAAIKAAVDDPALIDIRISCVAGLP